MFCPNCDSEYRPGFTRCPECNVDLLERPARQETSPQLAPDLKVIFASGDASAIAVAKSLLISEQIQFMVRGEEVQDLFGVGRFPTGSSVVAGPIQLVVRPQDVGDATTLLSAIGRESAAEVIERPEDGGPIGPADAGPIWRVARVGAKVAAALMLMGWIAYFVASLGSLAYSAFAGL